MKVLVCSQEKTPKDVYESMRSKSVTTDALELVGVKHTGIRIEKYDIANIVGPISESDFDEVAESGAPIIISAFYSEADPNTAFAEESFVDGGVKFTLSSKIINMLNRANCILVPCKNAVSFLDENGVTTETKVVIPGVNLSRFSFSRDDEKEIFYRYFKETKGIPIVIASGRYKDSIDGINAFINAANKSPKAAFYYFGTSYKKDSVPRGIKAKIRNAPKNAHFYVNIPDDVYCSALLNASVFLLPGYCNPSMNNLMDAMAAKCQIISRRRKFIEEYIENEVTGYLADYSETLGILVREYLNGDIEPTIDKAYDFVKEHTLEDFGERLVKIYKEFIK